MFAIEYYCGPKYGWMRGRARFPSSFAATSEILLLRKLCVLADGTCHSLRVVPA